MNPAPKLHGLDHLRAFAILYVFLFHYFILSDGLPSWLPDFANFGWTGVDLFFVLSGFLIASQLFAQIKKTQNVDFKTFFVKRFFRIVPAYVVVVALYFLWAGFREKESLPPLWKFLTFTQNLGLNLQHFGTFSHAWSLCVEEHFYLLLPLVLMGLLYTKNLRHAGWLLAGLFAAGLVFRAVAFLEGYAPHATAGNSWMYWYQYVYYPTYNRLDGLLVGVGIAALYQFKTDVWAKISGYGNVLFFAGVGILVLAAVLCADAQQFGASVYGFPLVSLGYGCWVASAISPKSFLFRWRSVITSQIATLSYGLYLTHKGVVHVIRAEFSGLHINENILLALCFALCLVVAYVLRRAVEIPFLRLRDRFLHQKV